MDSIYRISHKSEKNVKNIDTKLIISLRKAWLSLCQ